MELSKWQLCNFTPPKTVELSLEAPQIAGIYNFTVTVANRTNNLGLPDFVHAWNETLYVPVTMRDNPANITITPYDCKYNVPIKNAKGIAYALSNGQVAARAYLNETTGVFKLTGLDPSINQYDVQASAGLFKEPDGTTVAFSLTDFGQIYTGAVFNSTGVDGCLARAPQIWGHLEYRFSTGTQQDVPRALTDHPWLTSAGFKVLNITVEALDALGTHIYRNMTVSQDSSVSCRPF